MMPPLPPKRTRRLTGFDRRLLDTLNQQKGFFRYGNRIRFQIHMPLNEAALFYCLGKSPGNIVTEVIKNRFGLLAEALEWDGEENFWFDPNLLITALANQYRFYLPREAEIEEIEYRTLGKFPFVLIDFEKLPHNLKTRSVPARVNNTSLIIGEGTSFLISHNEIDKQVVELLAKMPTHINI